MTAFSTLPFAIRARFLAWSALMLAMMLIFGFRVLPSLRIETDILALLPSTQQSAVIDEALDTLSAELARKQLFLIGTRNDSTAKQAALAFAAKLRDSGAFVQVDAELNGDMQQRFAIYLQHRAFLLSPQDMNALRSGDTAALEQQALRAAYTPASFMQAVNLSQDPLGLINRFLTTQRMSIGNAQLDGAMLVVQRDGFTYALVVAESNGSPFAAAVQDRVLPAIDHASAAARTVDNEVRILSSGALPHAAAARQRATAEIATFGSLQLIGVIVLLWAMLGSIRPLALAALSLGIATAAAFTAVHYLFGTVHILALVFGSSLIGIVIDYSIHFFADRFRDPNNWTPVAAIRQVGGAILLGLLTTLMGYLVLAMVPFPGLKQIAVFCAVGLIAGCGCVLCWYPVWADARRKSIPTLGPRLGHAIDTFLFNWQWSRARIATTIVAGAIVAAGLLRIHIQDDIRALQESPPHLAQQEQEVAALLGGGVETRFFLVTGESQQATLVEERQLTAQLDVLIARGALNSYQAISSSVPPLAQQQAARGLLAEHVYNAGGLLERVMNKLGFPAEAVERRREEFLNSNTPLTIDNWLQSPAADSAKHLWLGEIDTRHATVVTLNGVRNVPALTQIEMPNTQLVDRVASTTQILGDYRRVLSLLLIGIYLAAGVVLSMRFGWRDALRILVPSALATMTTIGLFGWFGVPINLFTLLALWLALGLGIDYGIFLRHSQSVAASTGQDRAACTTAVLSVTLSATTTLLAFGLLALSATPFIRSIGLTLLCAIMLSWLFVLFSCLTTSRERVGVIHG
jgi:predicted exporter